MVKHGVVPLIPQKLLNTKNGSEFQQVCPHVDAAEEGDIFVIIGIMASLNPSLRGFQSSLERILALP
jgi:hypothetical protein